MALKFLFPFSESDAVIPCSFPRRLLTFASIKRGETMAVGVDVEQNAQGLIFGLSSRLPASTALLSPGQIRLPLQEQINSIAKCCGVLRGLAEQQLSHAPETRPCRTSRRSANLYVSNYGHSRVMDY